MGFHHARSFLYFLLYLFDKPTRFRGLICIFRVIGDFGFRFVCDLLGFLAWGFDDVDGRLKKPKKLPFANLFWALMVKWMSIVFLIIVE